MLNLLVVWCRERDLAWNNLETLDQVLVVLFGEMFFNGRSAEDANKLIAALTFLLQTFTQAPELQVPRAYRALRGWHRLAPNRQRLLLPWVICAALIG
eukprot:7970214-Karenia_brevis.AAC.1